MKGKWILHEDFSRGHIPCIEPHVHPKYDPTICNIHCNSCKPKSLPSSFGGICEVSDTITAVGTWAHLVTMGAPTATRNRVGACTMHRACGSGQIPSSWGTLTLSAKSCSSETNNTPLDTWHMGSCQHDGPFLGP